VKRLQIDPARITRGFQKQADVVILDPPRKRCEKEVLNAVAAMRLPRIVYVSCDSATLARDLGILNKMWYQAAKVQPVDMFPWTGHVECVCFLENPIFRWSLATVIIFI
jgi:23S rRNA (uracil1939-C5)-methyltransferase